ncbi:hypothetical protein DFQ28_010501 [Apophysomyces sp. BC1034]|nr:hypothetical protein DFQ28_010501 [Apophysomyces sp. BC1034]
MTVQPIHSSTTTPQNPERLRTPTEPQHQGGQSVTLPTNPALSTIASPSSSRSGGGVRATPLRKPIGLVDTACHLLTMQLDPYLDALSDPDVLPDTAREPLTPLNPARLQKASDILDKRREKIAAADSKLHNVVAMVDRYVEGQQRTDGPQDELEPVLATHVANLAHAYQTLTHARIENEQGKIDLHYTALDPHPENLWQHVRTLLTQGNRLVEARYIFASQPPEIWKAISGTKTYKARGERPLSNKVMLKYSLQEDTVHRTTREIQLTGAQLWAIFGMSQSAGLYQSRFQKQPSSHDEARLLLQQGLEAGSQYAAETTGILKEMAQWWQDPAGVNGDARTSAARALGADPLAVNQYFSTLRGAAQCNAKMAHNYWDKYFATDDSSAVGTANVPIETLRVSYAAALCSIVPRLWKQPLNDKPLDLKDEQLDPKKELQLVRRLVDEMDTASEILEHVMDAKNAQANPDERFRLAMLEGLALHMDKTQSWLHNWITVKLQRQSAFMILSGHGNQRTTPHVERDEQAEIGLLEEWLEPFKAQYFSKLTIDSAREQLLAASAAEDENYPVADDEPVPQASDARHPGRSGASHLDDEPDDLAWATTDAAKPSSGPKKKSKAQKKKAQAHAKLAREQAAAKAAAHDIAVQKAIKNFDSRIPGAQDKNFAELFEWAKNEAKQVCDAVAQLGGIDTEPKANGMRVSANHVDNTIKVCNNRLDFAIHRCQGEINTLTELTKNVKKMRGELDSLELDASKRQSRRDRLTQSASDLKTKISQLNHLSRDLHALIAAGCILSPSVNAVEHLWASEYLSSKGGDTWYKVALGTPHQNDMLEYEISLSEELEQAQQLEQALRSHVKLHDRKFVFHLHYKGGPIVGHFKTWDERMDRRRDDGSAVHRARVTDADLYTWRERFNAPTDTRTPR